MDDAKWERWGALGGIVFAVLIAITIIIPGTPPKTTDSTAKIVKFVADNGDQIRYATYLGALGAVFLFWWLGSVWRLMRRNEAGNPRLTVVAAGGAIFASVLATIGGIILGVMPLVGTRTLGPGGTRAFYVLSTSVGFGTLFGIAAFVGAVSALILRTRMLPVALGWLGTLLALVSLVGAAGVASTRDALFVTGFIAFIGFLLWVLAVSIIMLRQPEGAQA